ncbi:MAG: hypothetical protein PUH99_00270, partial [Firmicutes bacterium]|nr:hypothetical protein [Bacillota bacterium]MDY5530939.1 hypothetical protein [Pumilibacteraceae bacterium]
RLPLQQEVISTSITQPLTQKFFAYFLQKSRLTAKGRLPLQQEVISTSITQPLTQKFFAYFFSKK